MAVFLLKAIHGASYSPPPAAGTFADVPAGYWAAAWIEQLAAGVQAKVVIGSRSSRRPRRRVARESCAGDGAGSNLPDMFCLHTAAEGITGGCGAGVYCPENPVTRDQMAVFLVEAFNLP